MTVLCPACKKIVGTYEKKSGEICCRRCRFIFNYDQVKLLREEIERLSEHAGVLSLFEELSDPNSYATRVPRCSRFD